MRPPLNLAHRARRASHPRMSRGQEFAAQVGVYVRTVDMTEHARLFGAAMRNHIATVRPGNEGLSCSCGQYETNGFGAYEAHRQHAIAMASFEAAQAVAQ